MLHPQARALIARIEESGDPPIEALAPVDARRLFRERRKLLQPAAPEVQQVESLRAEGPNGLIPLRLYRPLGSARSTPQPTLIYFHGGGFVVGDLDSYDVLCRELANASSCAVVSVDYPLAPEHPFPAAVTDCLAAVYWVRRHAETLGVDRRCLAVGGDSAGGNLAAVVSVLARDARDLPLAFQLLIYPCTDWRCLASSHRTYGAGLLLTSDAIRYYMGHYLPDLHDAENAMASPLLFKDLSGLPTALVLTAGYDPLRDEGVEYAQRLSKAGTPCSQVCFERQLHGFVAMGGVIDEAACAVSVCAAELNRALRGR
jgi:acetyl esterase